MAEFGGALDRWLEAPYRDAALEEEAFEAWCELTGTDSSLVGAWERWERERPDNDYDGPTGPTYSVDRALVAFLADFDEPVQIGYSRHSDDSVSSSRWDLGALRDSFIHELVTDDDIASAWFRTLTEPDEARTFKA